LTAIANAGRGKAEFIVRDEQIKEIIVRQFARVSSANLFHIQLNNKENRVIDKIEKTRTLFNHEFYDLLLETDAVTDDFELVCKTGDKQYSFIIQKETLEESVIPLDKIYASEQIRRAEKYIEARPYNENKGYKEQIVEIAVLYQIDSRYTAFIAVNERDEKLTDIPQLQDIDLESPSGWEMDNVRACNIISADHADYSTSKKVHYYADYADYAAPSSPPPTPTEAKEAVIDGKPLIEATDYIQPTVERTVKRRISFNDIFDEFEDEYETRPVSRKKMIWWLIILAIIIIAAILVFVLKDC
jgi:hypothetical protein